MNTRIARAITSAKGLVGPRGRTIARTGAWSIIAKVCGAANLFISVPFVLQTLGPAQFGAWATLASLMTVAGFLDFGFSNGTMNLVAAAHGRNAPSEIATILGEGMRALWKIAGVVAVTSIPLVLLIPWHKLLGLPDIQAGAARAAAAGVLVTIVLGIPMSLASRAQLAVSRGDRAFRWQAFGQLVTLLVVILCARANASLPTLTWAAVATPLTATLANTIDLHRSHRGMQASRSPGIARNIRREGALFFVLQLASALAYSSDLALISALRGPADAGAYAIVQRLFSLIPLGLSLLWVPLWPAYRQSLAAGDHAWVLRTLRHTIVLAALASAAGGVILALGFDQIEKVWIRKTFSVSGWLLAGFVFWYVIDAVGNGIAAFMNAASIVRYQVIVASCFALICFTGKAWAIEHYGVIAVPWMTSAIYGLVSLLPTILLGRRIILQALAKTY